MDQILPVLITEKELHDINNKMTILCGSINFKNSMEFIKPAIQNLADIIDKISHRHEAFRELMEKFP